MTEAVRESTQFRKGKTPIMAKYRADHAKLFAVIAGRGFLNLPGYAYDAETDLELMTKLGLSELNYKILSETIERELKQTGIGYTQLHKNAVMAWEVEKQDLLADWDAEFAGIKRGMAEDEETRNLLAIEVGKRAITLLEQKTAIEEEAEGYKKTLAELDGDTAPYEVQLANAKLLTAQRKLTLIPILEEIVTKEQELLVIEEGKAAAYTDLMKAEQELSVKKQTLTPYVNQLAGKAEQYAAKISSKQIPMENQIASEKVNQANAAAQKADYQVDEITEEIETETKKLDLMDEKRDTQETQFNNEQRLILAEKELDAEYHGDEMEQSDDLLEQEQAAAATLLSDKQTVHNTQNQTRVTSANTIANSTMSTGTQINNLENSEMTSKATIEAASRITAQLTHLIG